MIDKHDICEALCEALTSLFTPGG